MLLIMMRQSGTWLPLHFVYMQICVRKVSCVAAWTPYYKLDSSCARPIQSIFLHLYNLCTVSLQKVVAHCRAWHTDYHEGGEPVLCPKWARIWHR